MTNRNIETEIRKALDAQAHGIDVPDGLAERTLEMARQSEPRGVRARARAWRDGRRSRARVTGYPRVLYAAGAAATAVLLFVVGSVVIDTGADRTITAPAGQAYNEQDSTTTDTSGPIADVPAVGAPELKAREMQGDAIGGQAARDAESADSDARTRAGASSGVAQDEIAPVPPAPAAGKFPPKIIRNADVGIEVKSFDTAWNRANSIATRYGGFITNSSTELVKDRLGRGTLVMRVPAAKLDAAIADLRKLGTLDHMQTSGDDISAPLADVKARLRALQAQELQLLELMGRARTLSETLEVRSQLDSVRQEIESYKAQRDVYENQVAFSTINATIFEKGVDPSDGDDDPILVDAWDTALRIGLTVIAGTLVILGGLIPLAALVLAIWFVVRAVRRRSPPG